MVEYWEGVKTTNTVATEKMMLTVISSFLIDWLYCLGFALASLDVNV